MMVMPSGRRRSAPVPVAISSGTAPSSAAMVVIRMGRKRCRQASWIACSGVRPRRRCASRAKSTSMMPFFLTIPIKRMMPMKAMMVSSAPNKVNASNAPRPADGRVEMIVNGWARLS